MQKAFLIKTDYEMEDFDCTFDDYSNGAIYPYYTLNLNNLTETPDYANPWNY